MSGNTLIALVVLTAVLQQITTYIQSVIALSSITDPTAFVPARNAVIIKGISLLLGVAIALVFQFNLIPAGTFPETVPLAALVVLSGIAVGLGYDFALGLIKAGSNVVAVTTQSVEQRKANIQKTASEIAHYRASTTSLLGSGIGNTASSTTLTPIILSVDQIEAIADLVYHKLEAADMGLDGGPTPSVAAPAPASGG